MCGCRKNTAASGAKVARNGILRNVNTQSISQVRPQSAPIITNATALSAERRKTQAIRRDIIRKTFGK